jgi:hypothetical protein
MFVGRPDDTLTVANADRIRDGMSNPIVMVVADEMLSRLRVAPLRLNAVAVPILVIDSVITALLSVPRDVLNFSIPSVLGSEPTFTIPGPVVAETV